MLDVVGHEGAKQALRELSSHTLLFVGPSGVGRRHVARWYAALRNCQNSGNEPCGSCESCRLFLEDAHPDYREIGPSLMTSSGRANRRPEIRIGQLVARSGGDDDPLSSWLELRPQFSSRVAVIDQADTLTVSAANSFLKFLEEPPSYAVIILIAPSSQSVLATIASRSTLVRFGTVTLDAAPTNAPALSRLGRYGLMQQLNAHPDAYASLTERIDSFVLALPKSLEQAFEEADALEKAWTQETTFDVTELLTARFSDWPPAQYAAAVNALNKCDEALSAYASPSLALQVFTLELREIVKDIKLQVA